MESKCGVYLIVSPSNGRYVGSSKRMDKRFNRYKNYSCSRQSAIYSSLKKYGFENHTIKILMYCEETERLFWERVFGDLYLSSAEHKNGLNLLLPGYGDVPSMVTQDFRNKISITQRKRFENPAERINTSVRTKAGFTEEVKRKMSVLHKERCNTDEFRQERSRSRKNYFSNPENREKLGAAIKKSIQNNPIGKESSRAALEKYYQENPTLRSDRMKKRYLDNPNLWKEHGCKMKKMYEDNPERRKIVAEKTRLQIQKNGHNMSRKVINTDTGQIYPTVKEAATTSVYCENTFRKILQGNHRIKLPYKYL